MTKLAQNNKAFTRTKFRGNRILNGFTRTRINPPNGGLNGDGFTLVEMMIAIVLIAVLALLFFLVLNPSEIQKKARDNSRMRDLTNLDGAFTRMTMDKKNRKHRRKLV